jgi:hypothetical protein
MKRIFSPVALAMALLAGFSMGIASGALEPPSEFTVSKDGNNLNVGFGTVVGQTYTVEKSTTLAPGSWTEILPNVAGTGAVQTTTDANAASLPKCFYRIRYGVTPAPTGMVLVQGGTLPDIGNGVLNVATFSIGKYEVTWGEWQPVRTWAAAKGYDIGSVGSGAGDNYPVFYVNWYQCVKWCNARSEKEGLTPVYTVGGAIYRSGQNNDVAVNASANGYRLPTDAEWEFAARGGTQSQGYTYSGSNDLNAVAWYYGNSGNAPHVVGTKAVNELGIHDMSGNAWEWCFDWYPGYTGSYWVFRGGGWNGMASYCRVANRNYGYGGPADGLSGSGFRCARTPPPQS